jgi:hypothetical protein
MTSEIVNRLRKNSECLAPSIMLEAADEIERLRHELDGARLAYRGASHDRDRMRAERDEARREVCQFRSTSYPHDMKEVYEIADSSGWDCYKEDGK